MVKNKTGRDMNPADAFRKVQRQKEIMRNKKERSFQRDAAKLKSNPDALKDELREVISMQEEGKVNLSVRLKQKAYKHALDTSIKSRKAEEARAEAGEPAIPAFVAGHGHGVPEQRPENSVYYHPTLNPSGTPPPGKPQRYRTAPALPAPPAAGIPVPKPPPLPKGPAPPRPVGALPPPPTKPPLPPGPRPAGAPPAAAPAAFSGATVLPPPDEPPPNFAVAGSVVLPPPDDPPPAVLGVGGELPKLPPPPGPPPGMGQLPPPLMPPPGAPPGMMLPPPGMPPPGFMPPPGYHSAPRLAAKPVVQAVAINKEAATISGASTVAKRIPAQQDKIVTSMVPASLRVKREAAAIARPVASARSSAAAVGPGFGLAPTMPAPKTAAPVRRHVPTAAPVPDDTYNAFMADMASLGAFS